MEASQALLAAYDTWASQYDEHPSPMVLLSRVALEQRRSWFAQQAVLELGCGTGRLATDLLRWGARRYTGIDQSRGMMGVGIARYRVRRMVSFLAHDLNEVLITPPVADRVLICLVLEHLEDVYPILKTAYEAISQGGEVLVVELHPQQWQADRRAKLPEDLGGGPLPSYLHTDEELKETAAQAGLQHLETERYRPTQLQCSEDPRLLKYVGEPSLLIQRYGLA